MALWVVEIVDRFFFAQGLEIYGLHGGNWSHWQGILLAPLLHLDWGHLTGNSLGLLTFGPVILLRGWERLATATFIPIFAAGAFTIFMGDVGSIHLGASSVVFGYFGFLVGLGFYERTPLSILIAGIVLYAYWHMFYTMYPSDYTAAQGISWEGHLGGALGGLISARQFRRR